MGLGAAAIGVAAMVLFAVVAAGPMTRAHGGSAAASKVAGCGGTPVGGHLERAAGITTSLTSLRVTTLLDSEVCHALLSNTSGATGAVLAGGRLRILTPKSLLIAEFSGGMLGPASVSAGAAGTCSVDFPFSLFFGPAQGAAPVMGSMVGSWTRRGILTPAGCRTLVATLTAAVTLEDPLRAS